MKSHDLAKLLLSLPNATVEVNDNMGGSVFPISQVDHFEVGEADDYEIIMIQVNCSDDRRFVDDEEDDEDK